MNARRFTEHLVSASEGKQADYQAKRLAVLRLMASVNVWAARWQVSSIDAFSQFVNECPPSVAFSRQWYGPYEDHPQYWTKLLRFISSRQMMLLAAR